MTHGVLQNGAFRLTAFDEGGVRGSAEHRRLVCIVASGGKLAIWGKDGARKNIDAVLRVGVPCEVECQYRQPNEIHATEYGHRYWVREDCRLLVKTVPQPTAPLSTARQSSGPSQPTVGQFYFSHRDEHGRAWVDARSWLEQASGCFRLNSPNGEATFAAGDAMQLARAEAKRRAGGLTEAQPDELDDSDDDVATAQGRGPADQFDDFRGGGGWPGPSADDAEAEDFEDSIGDLMDPEMQEPPE